MPCAPLSRATGRLVLALGCALAMGCGAARGATGREEPVRIDGRWSEEARARLERVIAEHGRGGPRFDPARPPVAVFDWDNTTMRGDIGDLALAEALREGTLLLPARWEALAPLTDDALVGLAGACAGHAPGSPLGLETSPTCASVVAHVAYRSALPDGRAAFVTPVGRYSRASYAFMAQLFSGLTPDAVAALGRAAFDAAAARPADAVLDVGGVEVEGHARVVPEMASLGRALEAAGFEVWVVSASHQALVAAIAPEAGLDPARVIGARPRFDPEGGRYAPGWTAVVDGDDVEVMTFDEGKRAWIAREIFGVRDARALAPPEPGARRPVLAIGDSDTDLAMLEDATDLAILFDRGAPRATAAARAHPERFVIEPRL